MRLNRDQRAHVEGHPLRDVSLPGTAAVTKIAHGLGYVPTMVIPGVPTAAATISQPSPADATFVYLLSSAACTVTLWVW